MLRHFWGGRVWNIFPVPSASVPIKCAGLGRVEIYSRFDWRLTLKCLCHSRLSKKGGNTIDILMIAGILSINKSGNTVLQKQGIWSLLIRTGSINTACQQLGHHHFLPAADYYGLPAPDISLVDSLPPASSWAITTSCQQQITTACQHLIYH